MAAPAPSFRGRVLNHPHSVASAYVGWTETDSLWWASGPQIDALCAPPSTRWPALSDSPPSHSKRRRTHSPLCTEPTTFSSDGEGVVPAPADSLRCERCGEPEPIDRDRCDGPCERWVGEECYRAFGPDEIFCYDCRPVPAPPTRPVPVSDLDATAELGDRGSPDVCTSTPYYLAENLREESSVSQARRGPGEDKQLTKPKE